MNYKSVIDRILDNLHIDGENSKDIKKIKHDIEDTMVSAFGLSEQPRKEVYLEVEKTEDIVESFDGILKDDFSMSIFDCAGDAATYDLAAAESKTATMLYVNLRRVNTFGLTVSKSLANGTLDGVAEILDQNDNVLFTEAFVVTNVETIYTFEPYLVGVNLQAKITINTTVAPLSDITITADDFTINIDSNEIEMPSDFFIPYEVRLDNEDGVRLFTKELSRSQYVSWTPNKIYNDSLASSITDSDSFVNVMNYSEENIDFDGAFGYFFQVKDGKTYLTFKPTIKGTIIVSYSYIPDIQVQDADTIQINRRFLDLVVYGATLRELTRKLTLPTLGEIELAGIRSAIGIYKRSFDVTSNFFTNFANKRSEPAMVTPFTLLNDSDMELY